MLRHLEGLSYNDISRITNLPVGTVKTYLHRARKKLREELKDYLD
ncbi:MAG TPA: sigma factor-like helix-turn-helix DNA-binding protein [Candidatus Atribacteria bacterium]|nr:sigma factor-like helix-turn-helix DNA-binding protein [Candidatus Atribacteria bacterium]